MVKILSTNIGAPTEVEWKGKRVKTGIFKYPVKEPVVLGKTDVEGDHVINREVHGGPDKAVYLYGANHYPHWQALYPDLPWDYGMFGENLTVDQCHEDRIYIGSAYRIGTAIVQVAQPRQPCFKLGIRFGDQGVLKHFVNDIRSGVYFRVIESGKVAAGDKMELLDEDQSAVSVAQLYRAIFKKLDDQEVISRMVKHQAIPVGLREYVAGLVE